MSKKVNFLKILFCLSTIGVLFTSCEKEDENEIIADSASIELEEAYFKNYMVITHDAQLTKSAEQFLKASGGSILSSIPEIGIAIVQSNDPAFMQKTMKSKEILSVVPDYEVKWIPTDVKNDLTSLDVTTEALTESPGSTEGAYFVLWGMEAISANKAWNVGYTGKGASVFVLDSGIDRENVEFAQNLNKSLSASFVPNEPYYTRPGRFANHGTHVAGTIAANKNNWGVIGVAYEADLVAVKVLSEYTGSGAFSSINAGIVYAANNGADVINMSLGATMDKSGKLIDADGIPYHIPAVYIQDIIKAQQRAIDYAYNKGVTIVASAGNDYTNYDGNTSFIKLPGGLNNVITVSASAPEGWYPNPNANFDVPASYTTYGRSLVDVGAPGGDFDVNSYDMIYSVASGVNAFNFNAGTSMAAPHVSGVAALIIAKNGGSMNPKDVQRQIENTSDAIGGNGQSLYFGKGRVNALRAVTE